MLRVVALVSALFLAGTAHADGPAPADTLRGKDPLAHASLVLEGRELTVTLTDPPAWLTDRLHGRLQARCGRGEAVLVRRRTRLVGDKLSVRFGSDASAVADRCEVFAPRGDALVTARMR